MASQTTRLNRPWLLKMLAFGAVLFFFGLYGLYDATIAYPKRGERFAEFAQYQYMDVAKSSTSWRSMSVQDPKAELARLKAAPVQGAESAKQTWLNALAVIGKLTPERTVMQDPESTYAQLRQAWTADEKAKASPKPLSWYDIPVQWIFVAVGLGGAAYLAVLFVGVRSKSFSWEPETRALTLPSGQTITPADLEDVDKRKWDKFLVFLKIKPSHGTLGGQELKLDLYRYAPLEEWVLEMERQAFPDRALDGDLPPPPPSSEPVEATASA